MAKKVQRMYPDHWRRHAKMANVSIAGPRLRAHVVPESAITCTATVTSTSALLDCNFVL